MFTPSKASYIAPFTIIGNKSTSSEEKRQEIHRCEAFVKEMGHFRTTFKSELYQLGYTSSHHWPGMNRLNAVEMHYALRYLVYILNNPKRFYSMESWAMDYHQNVLECSSNLLASIVAVERHRNYGNTEFSELIFEALFGIPFHSFQKLMELERNPLKFGISETDFVVAQVLEIHGHLWYTGRPTKAFVRAFNEWRHQVGLIQNMMGHAKPTHHEKLLELAKACVISGFWALNRDSFITEFAGREAVVRKDLQKRRLAEPLNVLYSKFKATTGTVIFGYHQ